MCRFDAWIRAVDSYIGNDLSYLNSKGIIPPTAVIKRNERRANPFREKKKFDSTNFPVGGKSSLDDLQPQMDEDEDEDEQVLDRTKLADTEG